ncbi:MAG: hypothetical protein ABI216_15970 [Devosia sp.]
MHQTEPTEEQFLHHVAKHELSVGLASGAHRHLLFKAPGTSNRHFHLVTWPRYLAITGDMGCYVFARAHDMFQFFRHPDVNLPYWAEKLESGRNEVSELSEERFRATIDSDFDGWSFDDVAQKAAARAALDRSDLAEAMEYHDEDGAVGKVLDYICPITGHHFADFHDQTLSDFTYHFVWCCRAIRWGIEKFDETMVERAVEPA